MAAPDAFDPMTVPARPLAPAQSDLVTAVVNLVETGPVPLGAYTPAEVAAVGGLIEWLEAEPGPEAMTEAVRSRAARDLITTEAGGGRRSRSGAISGSRWPSSNAPGSCSMRASPVPSPMTPWRFLLLPQPEQITLEVQIDVLEIHYYSLRKDARGAAAAAASNYPAGRKALPPPTSIRLSPRAPRRRS